MSKGANKMNAEKKKDKIEEDVSQGVQNEENAKEGEGVVDSTTEAGESELDEMTEKNEDSIDEELAKKQAEYDELHGKYLRIYSEFDNFRKRTTREKLDLIDTANEKLMLDILPVVDDFERAMMSMKDAGDVKSVQEGVVLIFNKLKGILERNGLEEIDCLEKEFDPEIHEALTKIPAPKKKLRGKVVDQIQKGYKLKNKVIRFAKVVVGE